MYRYSTEPINVFLRFDPRETKEFWLTFKQEASGVEITREKADLVAAFEKMEQTEDGWYNFPVEFTQEESSSFEANEAVLVQARWSDREGHSDMTVVASFPIEDVL